ncbi:hypothetical protein ABTZ78_17560 [Streptomyces bauhiniae]|uniref:hypothetical protein n=1 Tax=Streptomyces bauhiniae TaxID=2340725 RepID=UPI003320D51D
MAKPLQLLPTDDRRLNAVRRDLCDEVLNLLGGPPRVATYVCDQPGLDPAYWHGALAALATRHGWRVVQQHFTDQHDAEGSPQFNAACRHAAGGFIDGILIIRRHALDLRDDEYEQRLRWLREHRAFLAVHRQLDTGSAW